MKVLKMMALKTKRRKLVNGLSWLVESDPHNPKITEMTNDLQQVNLKIDKIENKIVDDNEDIANKQ